MCDMYTYMCIYIYICVDIYIYKSTQYLRTMYRYEYVNVYIYRHIYTYIYIYIYIYIYTYTYTVYTMIVIETNTLYHQCVTNLLGFCFSILYSLTLLKMCNYMSPCWSWRLTHLGQQVYISRGGHSRGVHLSSILLVAQNLKFKKRNPWWSDTSGKFMDVWIELFVKTRAWSAFRGSPWWRLCWFKADMTRAHTVPPHLPLLRDEAQRSTARDKIM
jgi:hypothetical protein